MGFRRWRAGLMAASVACCTVSTSAQSLTVAPLRTAPTEKLTVNPGFRDWSPTTVVDVTILGGNRTNRGGVLAIDAVTGQVKWTYRPTFNGGTASVSTAPAVANGIVATPFAMAYPGAVVGVSLAAGKEVWRGPDPATDAAVEAAVTNVPRWPPTGLTVNHSRLRGGADDRHRRAASSESEDILVGRLRRKIIY